MKSDHEEALEIIGRLSTTLLYRLPTSGREASDARLALGDLSADLASIISDEELGDKLLSCFDLVKEAGAMLATFDDVRIAMMVEEPVYDLGLSIMVGAITFALIEQSKILSEMKFVSRDDVRAMIIRMAAVIDDIKLTTSELLDGANYQNIIELSSSLIHHLSFTERQLPRVVSYDFRFNHTALYLSNRIYHVGSRSEELIQENRTVHPAFMQQHIKALSE